MLVVVGVFRDCSVGVWGGLIVVKKFSKHTPEQIVRKLEQADKLQAAGSTVAQVCRQLQINKATFAPWRTINDHGALILCCLLVMKIG